jgi:hypothetical protein
MKSLTLGVFPSHLTGAGEGYAWAHINAYANISEAAIRQVCTSSHAETKARRHADEAPILLQGAYDKLSNASNVQSGGKKKSTAETPARGSLVEVGSRTGTTSRGPQASWASQIPTNAKAPSSEAPGPVTPKAVAGEPKVESQVIKRKGFDSDTDFTPLV